MNKKTETLEKNSAVNNADLESNERAARKKEYDYSTLGLKVGIEIHQQLDTAKLFCSCPSTLRDDAPHFTIKRMLHAVAGETGEIDIAAAHEAKKEKWNIYEGYKDTTCLVELDEEPPHEVNKEALQTCLQLCILLNAKPVDIIQFMRKTVLDGSNTTGFQRTGLVAMNGILETSKGKIRITNICLEEEAAKRIEDEKDHIKWRLDRLGIPLIEIGTDADIKSPEQCKEAAETIGMMLRSTNRVKRGLGTIRQDVNVSIKGGNRVEIKGAQDLRMLQTLIEYETERQTALLEIKKELEKRFIDKDIQKIIDAPVEPTKTSDLESAEASNHISDPAAPPLMTLIYDITSVFKNTESKIIKTALTKKGAGSNETRGVVLGIKLERFSGLLGGEVQPGRRLGTEFSDCAKIVSGIGGIFHSDELPKYGITEDDVSKICSAMGAKENDAFIIVADERKTCEKALKACHERAKLCFKGVPKEVRKANDDGTTSFQRPMPGAARMYPETDVRLTKIDLKRIRIPELISDKAARYEELGLSKDLAKQMAKSEEAMFFEKMVENNQNIKPLLIADTLLTKTKEIKTRLKLEPSKITEKDFEEIFSHLNNGSISKEAVFEIMTELSKGASIGVIKKYELLSDIELEKELRKIVQENKELTLNALIGKAMAKLRGKADGQKIVKTLSILSAQLSAHKE